MNGDFFAMRWEYFHQLLTSSCKATNTVAKPQGSWRLLVALNHLPYNIKLSVVRNGYVVDWSILLFSRYKFKYIRQLRSMIHCFPYIYTQSNIFCQVVTGWNTRWAPELHGVLVYHILRQFRCMSSKWPLPIRGHRSTIIPESQI